MSDKTQAKMTILAPAGSRDAFIAAVENGADAIYLGGKLFNARQFANNFELEEIKELTRYAHFHGVQVLITLNILILNHEMKAVLNFAHDLADVDVDGIIVQDIGLAMAVRELLPKTIEIHASTQMTIMNSPGVRFVEEMGLSQVVLAREVSLKNIKEIHNDSQIKLEGFGHGALCSAYSGQCLMSSFMGGRSGNRGQCAQPCRMKYKLINSQGKTIATEGEHLLSMKDLCTIELLEPMTKSGLAAVKLEGRMKRAEYVAIITDQYHQAINGNKIDHKVLARCYNRGLTDGYYKLKPGAHLLNRLNSSIEPLKDTALLNAAKATYQKLGSKRKQPIHLIAEARIGKPLILHGRDDLANEVTVFSSNPCELALKHPTSEKQLQDQLNRFGNSLFEVADIQIILDPQVMVPASIINQLRRQLIDEMAEKKIAKFNKAKDSEQVFAEKVNLLEQKLVQDDSQEALPEPTLTIRVSNLAGIKAALAAGIKEIYFGGESFQGNQGGIWGGNDIALATELCQQQSAKAIYVLPRFFHENQIPQVKQGYAWAQQAGVDGFLVGNPGALMLCREWNCEGIMTDWSWNVTNEYTIAYLESLGVQRICYSTELTMGQIKDLHCQQAQGELVIHGRLPLMTLEHCLPGTLISPKGCQNCCQPCNKDQYFLEDRLKFRFPIATDQDCRDWIFNAKTLSMLPHLAKFPLTKLAHLRIEAINETPEWISQVALAYRECLEDLPSRQQALTTRWRAQLAELTPQGFTTGHYFRGIDQQS